ncbi:hypothetical protein EMIHUDRAFT_446199, partial [Emiliania huxleyi CCMP1516]|uniref:Uncharacterized protein n=2 Tax=Emiliania huxleyi TaxID=2903 RepID=A0A0D3IGL2_EMIH1
MCGIGLAPACVLLIHFGADVDARDNAGLAPVHMAAGYANAQCLRVLIAAGADHTAVGDQGTPLDVVERLDSASTSSTSSWSGAAWRSSQRRRTRSSRSSRCAPRRSSTRTRCGRRRRGTTSSQTCSSCARSRGQSGAREGAEASPRPQALLSRRLRGGAPPPFLSTSLSLLCIVDLSARRPLSPSPSPSLPLCLSPSSHIASTPALPRSSCRVASMYVFANRLDRVSPFGGDTALAASATQNSHDTRVASMAPINEAVARLK